MTLSLRSIFFLLVATICPVLHTVGQGTNNIWAFGINSGLDFNSGNPEFFISKTKTSEGAATICNKDGSLKFYSDGNRVWNKDHELMPNGSGLLGNTGGHAVNYGSSTQGVAIVPFIGNADRYYLFTLDCMEGVTLDVPGRRGYLRYSVVDMSLNGGLGDVVGTMKNIVIDSGKSEKMIVAKGSNCFFWIITHQYGSCEYRTYKISSAGISPPVSSTTCTFDETMLTPRGSYAAGEMKLSPDQKSIAIVNNFPGCVELCSFDNRSGVVSHAARIYNSARFLYGISFSPNGRRFYVVESDGSGKSKYRMVQMDMTLLPDAEAVTRSATAFGDAGAWAGMRIGPDGNIYIAGLNHKTIYRIENPDMDWNACRLVPLNIAIPDSVYFQLGFGNVTYIQDDMELAPRTRLYNLCEKGGTAMLDAGPDYNEYMWPDGSTDEYFKPDSGGIYWVRAGNECGMVTDTFLVKNNCKGCTYLPTAFTPNSDGLNDCFRVAGDVNEIKELCVYDRWGTNVFFSTGVQSCWNGTNNGAPCGIGTYYYYTRGICKDGTSFFKKGDITLVR